MTSKIIYAFICLVLLLLSFVGGVIYSSKMMTPLVDNVYKGYVSAFYLKNLDKGNETVVINGLNFDIDLAINSYYTINSSSFLRLYLRANGIHDPTKCIVYKLAKYRKENLFEVTEKESTDYMINVHKNTQKMAAELVSKLETANVCT
jgi:hypothetical protein